MSAGVSNQRGGALGIGAAQLRAGPRGSSHREAEHPVPARSPRAQCATRRASTRPLRERGRHVDGERERRNPSAGRNRAPRHLCDRAARAIFTARNRTPAQTLRRAASQPHGARVTADRAASMRKRPSSQRSATGRSRRSARAQLAPAGGELMRQRAFLGGIATRSAAVGAPDETAAGSMRTLHPREWAERGRRSLVKRAAQRGITERAPPVSLRHRPSGCCADTAIAGASPFVALIFEREQSEAARAAGSGGR